ncbi:hypothetical protein GIB67_020247 [Kingdonia uniflora]|uniref:Uncharacterized protein n=1 Tax=Kingdonia uniflora TaxID=39325 RepID=A0A7J7P3P7_9MAGN|nr:hypothetical protein GIB67_020247 [Kingdonia uniflora]
MSSSSSATVSVEKATSEFLIGPDWTLNIEICDFINSNQWQAKDVVKAVKKRLLHKNPKVQFFSLTLLETMIKNCGEYVHFQVAERNILQEMIKIVRKKTDMRVRDKILILLDSWQAAFGGPGGKYPQYYWAYDELRRSGVEFPERSRDAAPIFTPPITHPMLTHPQAGYGMPSNPSIRLDDAMASEMENISISSLDSMRGVVELLADMLKAVNPNDREVVKDEVIVDLVSTCRLNQKKLMQMLSSTGDEELLDQGLALNDGLQSLLSKHDAIASGSPLPTEERESSPQKTEERESSTQKTEVSDQSPTSNSTTVVPTTFSTSSQDEEEEDDDFAQLARRRTKNISVASGSTTAEDTAVAAAAALIPNANNALALPTPLAPINTTKKEQDMIDLLSITLSTASTSPHSTPLPSASNEVMHHQPSGSPNTTGYPSAAQPQPQPQPLPFIQGQYGSPNTSGYPSAAHPQPQPFNQGQVPYNNYVVPWAHTQQQPQYTPQYSSPHYPPPPWASSDQSVNVSPNTHQYARPSQNFSSSPLKGGNDHSGSPRYRGEQMSYSATGQKASFIPSYRLFEDLNVLGNNAGDRGAPSKTGTSGSNSAMSGPSMVSGRK